jgi:hypothetical protein
MQAEEQEVREYVVRCDYTVLVEKPGAFSAIVLATSADEAVEKAWDKVYEFEGGDSDTIDEGEAVITSSRDVSVRGALDDLTLNLFPEVSRGTNGGKNAEP